MKSFVKIVICFAMCLAAALLACACGGGVAVVTPDPHEGLVQVSDGNSGLMWVELQEGVETTSFRAEEFTRQDGFINYTGLDFDVSQGVDVSFYQGDIDWRAVAGDGVDFALIRLGYRGWSEGGLFEDELFGANLVGAAEAGIQTGVYFFSQAVSVEEAAEEARFVLETLNGALLQLPVFFDWERVTDAEARTAGMSGELMTDCALAFCAEIQAGGYEPGVYLYRRIGYNDYDLARLSGIPLWVGAIGEDYPDFYYDHELWQYAVDGQVAGIDGEVDLNLWLLKREQPADNLAETPAPQSQ